MGSAGTSLAGSDGEALLSAGEVPGTALVVGEDVSSDAGVEMLSVDKLGGDDMVDGENVRWAVGVSFPRACKLMPSPW